MTQSINTKKERASGFTILELLIVVSIVAILSVALVVVLNPAETLKQSRDANRISDLSTMKKAIALYMTSTSTPFLGNESNNTGCKTTPESAFTEGGANGWLSFSIPSETTITDTSLISRQASTANYGLTNGAGWIPVNFDTIIGGSPISNLPVDPINKIVTLSSVLNTDLVYRYACSSTPLAFEMNAQLESEKFTSGTNDKRTNDGGNDSNFYEVGTNLGILGLPGFVCGASTVSNGTTQSATIVIGTQCWMALNMNVGTRITDYLTSTDNAITEKYCYDNDESICTSDGALYQWAEAMQYSETEGAQGICPIGWHIPRDSEQHTLDNFLKDEGETCDPERELEGYDCSGADTKLKVGGSSGFNGIFAGRNGEGFSDRSERALLWSSSQSGGGWAWLRRLDSDAAAVLRQTMPKPNGFSVRCVKD